MPTTVKLEKIQLEEQLNLTISQQILDKIRYLCKCINKVEWSGVLFYKITGTIEKPEEFSMEVIDIFLMDKGTSGYTEYTFDDDVATFMMDKAMENPEWMTYKIGHIHSHNTMGVFFSGVDMDELYDNCGNHNFYLSLIVNNYMDMIAKLVFRAVPKVLNVPFIAMNENGEEYSFSVTDNVKTTEPTPVLFVHECKVLTPHKEITVEDSFAERTKFIIDDSERKAKEKAAKFTKKNTPDDWRKENGNKLPATKHNAPNGRGSNFPAYGSNHNTVKNLLPATKGSEDNNFFNSGFDLSELVTEDEQFLCFVLRMGDKVDDDRLENALEDVMISGIEPAMLSSTIIDNYSDYYDRFYRDLSTITMDDFCDNIMTAVETLEDYKAKYDYVPDLVRELREFGTKLEEKWKEGLVTN